LLVQIGIRTNKNLRRTNMALTDAKLRALKAKSAAFKVSDAEGLFLLMPTSGAKLWRLAYRFDGKQKLLALGRYPAVTSYAANREHRLWLWGRTTAWKLVKSVMLEAGIAGCLCKPKALRHAFAIEAGQKGVPLNIVQRSLGHARIETTAIYASAIGEEERNLAKRAWSSLELAIPD
jgi:site-specific recombinase XerD